MIRTLAGLGAAVCCASTAAGQWWWPPSGGLSVSPACPHPTSIVELQVSGEWNTSCAPNQSFALVSGNEIDFFTVREPPPQVCLPVIPMWSRTELVGPLAAGTYTVFVTHLVSGHPVHPRTLIGTVQVSAACPAPCYPDCNGDGQLDLADFGCFQTKYALADPYADCNGDLVLNLADFGCFQTAFALGCP